MFKTILYQTRFIAIFMFAVIALIACASDDDAGRESVVAPTSSTEPTPTPAVSISNGETSVIVHLSPTEGEGQVGTATITSDGTTTTVEILIEPPTSEAQPIHIHAGICTEVGPVRHALQNVVKGSSTTTLDLPIAEVIGDGALVNVHASYADASNYTACGQLPTDLP